MARNIERLKAKKFFTEEGKTVPEISVALGVPVKTVYAWAKKDAWEKDRETVVLSGMASINDLKILAAKEIEAMRAAGTIDSKRADALVKVFTFADKLGKGMNHRQNILLGVKALTRFLAENHPEALDNLKPFLIEFGDWVKERFNQDA